MMLRSLVGEVVRRRMWPIPLVAILIAVAAPLLFMKSSDAEPAGLAPPPVAQPGKLPAGAGPLVSTSDKSAVPRTKARRKGQDPFAPPTAPAKPASETVAAVATSAPAAPAAGGQTAVVIKNSDGSMSTMAAPKSATKKTTMKKSTARKKATPKKKATTKKATTKKAKTPDPTTSSAAVKPTATYVDVRFGKRMGSYLRYRVPRLQSFRAGGRVAAMFVHHSAKRNVAVFAVAPSTKVAGDVECREVKGVCRYVDIPAGSYARLTLRDADGTWISRRLDVVSIRHLSGTEDPAPRVTALETATCLLKGLLKLAPSVPSITSDACA